MLSSSHHNPLHTNTRPLPARKKEFQSGITRTIKSGLMNCPNALFSGSYAEKTGSFFGLIGQLKYLRAVLEIRQAQIAINN
jgi:hypothetical protein